MADSTKQSCTIRSMNPWVLHLQKLGLELKCPLCLKLLKRPSLLPCDHIFCNSCLPETTQFGSECPLCKARYVDPDLRPMSFIENIVTIYRSLDAAFCANLFQSSSSDSGFHKLGKGSFEVALKDNLSSDRSTLSPIDKQLGQVPLNCSTENGVQKTDMEGKCNLQRDFRNKDHEIDTNGGIQECGNIQSDTHQVYQLSACSPPSLGDIKSSENDSCDQSPRNYEAQRSAKRIPDDRTRQDRHVTSTSGTDINSRDSKRHKKLNYGPLNICTNRVDLLPTNSQNGNLGISNCQPDHTFVKNFDAQTPALLSDSSIVKTVCGFCQSSNISKETGPMLHFLNGKLVEGDEAYLPNAIHVHKICIDWAPQVYFIDDQTVKNLKSEVVRGAKLKCSGCDRKGAALGCYHKSCRRSYHVMCAMEIAGCRWDYGDYLLLCPSHTSVRFPNEKKSKSKNRSGSSHAPSQHSYVPDKLAPQQSNFWAESSNGVKEWVFCGSALSSEEKSLLVEFGTMIGVPVTKFWRPDVTHVIAATDEKGACTRTLKVLMAILNGRWVLSIDWVKACMNSIHPVAEEAYEVCLDNHGCQNGPRTGRLSVLNDAPKLFNGFDFYFSGDFVSGYKEDLKNLVKAAGGNILETKEEIVQKCHDQSATPSRALVVYNLDPPRGCKLGEEVTILWQRLNEAEDLAAKIGSQVIGHTCLLESIASYKLQPFVSLH